MWIQSFFTIFIFIILSATFFIFTFFLLLSFWCWYSMTVYIIFVVFRFIMNCFWSTLSRGICFPGIICIIFTIILILSLNFHPSDDHIKQIWKIDQYLNPTINSFLHSLIISNNSFIENMDILWYLIFFFVRARIYLCVSHVGS